MTEKKPGGLTIRYAAENDAELILSFIRELAAYEKLSHQVTADAETLRKSLFINRQAEVLIAEYRGEPAGFALFFHNFSTFLGKANLYLEDLYIREALRGRGLGRAMLARLAEICRERGCERLDWWCLDENLPAIGFYTALGAKPMSEWTVFRLEGEALRALSEENI